MKASEYPRVELVWRDAVYEYFVADGGDPPGPELEHSVGYLLSDTDDAVVLGSNIDGFGVRCVTTIPRELVLEMRVLDSETTEEARTRRLESLLKGDILNVSRS